METINIVLCGLGGQGILFMTKVLAQAGLDKGLKVMGAETHGMAQRGGSVVSHLRFGQVESSLVKTDTARYLLALEEAEGYRNISFVAGGGRMYINTESHDFPKVEIREYLKKREILCRGVQAGRIAEELGGPLSSNLALLGYFAAMEESPASAEEMRSTIERISPERFRETNLRIFDAGVERAREEKPK
ncbi:MAG: indolepyruvate ferredoxin oxidoreductase [Desulfobacteraceae bacterium]|nr:MAG: indolepyruvate ferredoxin oxidoreductase [Desulfobacteraceae bacterium]